MYLWSYFFSEIPWGLHRCYQLTSNIVSGVEPWIFGTILDLNSAVNTWFLPKTVVTKDMAKNPFFKVFWISLPENEFEFGPKTIFWNSILKRGYPTSVQEFWPKNLNFIELSLFIMLDFTIFEKNIVLIDNFKSKKILTFLHFQKHGGLGNRILQAAMFFDFWFSRFLCKFKIINGPGSVLIFDGK